MKKAWFAISLILALILIPYAHAEDPPTADEFNKTLKDARQVTLKALQDRTDTIAEKQVNLPEWLEPIVKNLFRFEEPFTLSHVIIALCLFILFAVTFIDILQLFSLFSNTTSAIVGLLMTVIMSAAGMIYSMTLFLMDKGSVFRILADWSAGALFFIVIIIVLAFFILSKLFKWLEEYKLLRIAKKEGLEAGAELAFVKWVKNTYTNMANWVKS